MHIAIVADPDLDERLRCVFAIAAQVAMNAVPIASWEEVERLFVRVPKIAFASFTPGLAGAPEDAVAYLLERVGVLALTVPEGTAPRDVDDPRVVRVPRPIPEDRLVLLARGASGVSSQLRVDFPPVDLMQMICNSGVSNIVVVNDGASDVGVIELREGRVWTAYDGLGVGEEAFARLIRPEMRARLTSASSSTKEQTLFGDLMELVLDSLRRIDEGAVPPPPPLARHRVLAATISESDRSRQIGELSAAARRHLLSRSYEEAAKALLHLSELDPESSLVRANIDQLRRLGYIQ